MEKKKFNWRIVENFGGPTLLFVLAVIAVFYVSYKFFAPGEQDFCSGLAKDLKCDVEAENFKYGSFGGESAVGIPYPLFAVLPEVFPDLMPGPGGWASCGLAWEEGKELPVGFSKRRMGFERITQNCALCHTATYRTGPKAKPVIVPGGPSHTFDFGKMVDFIEAVGKDARFDPDVLMPPMEARFDFGWDDKLIYRYLVIPFAKSAIQEQSKLAAFRHEKGRPEWGPGRDAAFNLSKFILVGDKDDGTLDTADFMPLWDIGTREKHAINWAGETPDAEAVIKDSAMGFTPPAGPDFEKKVQRIRRYLTRLPAPKIPAEIAPDPEQVARGKILYADQKCADCHSWDGSKFGQPIPLTEIGTDPNRFNAWSEQDAARMNETMKSKGIIRNNVIKNSGYISVPLDGIWLRGPFLHNGSVPNLFELLKSPKDRSPKFYRGCDILDVKHGGFVSYEKDLEGCMNPYHFDTNKWGNGNGGHDYGTGLTDDERLDLVAYLMTL